MHIVEGRGLHIPSASPAPAVQWASPSIRVLFQLLFEAISSANARSFPCQVYTAHIMCISGSIHMMCGSGLPGGSQSLPTANPRIQATFLDL